MILIGAGNAPDLSKIDKSLASWTVKFPDICPFPCSYCISNNWCTNYFIIDYNGQISSNIFFVIKPNFLAPKVSNLKFTTDELLI